MATAQEARNRLIGFRVTQQEHDLLCRHALADQRTLTGMLRKMLGETVAGFGPTKREPRAQTRETSR
jgi:hypothetical protein